MGLKNAANKMAVDEMGFDKLGFDEMDVMLMLLKGASHLSLKSFCRNVRVCMCMCI